MGEACESEGKSLRERGKGNKYGRVVKTASDMRSATRGRDFSFWCLHRPFLTYAWCHVVGHGRII